MDTVKTYYQNNLTASFAYDTYGFPSSSTTGTIQNYSYNFDPVTGNLNWRQNNKYSGLREDFSYDNLDRLSLVKKGTDTLLKMTYDGSTGGLINKSDAGTFAYGSSSAPYAISRIEPTTGLVPSNYQSVKYNSFNCLDSISENGYKAEFIYSSDNSRDQMVVKQNGNPVLTRWYPTGSYIKETAGSVTKEYTFIGGDAYSAPAVAIKQSGATKYYSILRDHLGSITHIVDSTSTVVAEYSYDAWGRMRNPSTWVNYAPGSDPQLMIAGRGFTGHEHLPWFNTINMNGRLYDPLIGMFYSPDNYVQDGDNSQNFNRYYYCLNNPLIYSDPSGMLVMPGYLNNNLFNISQSWSDALDVNFWNSVAGQGAGGGVNGYVNEFLQYSHASFENGNYEASTSDYNDEYNKRSTTPDFNGTTRIQVGTLEWFTFCSSDGGNTWIKGRYINSEPIYETMNFNGNGDNKLKNLYGWSITGTMTDAAGYGISIGEIYDPNTKQFIQFLSHGPAFGWDNSVGIHLIIIKPKEGFKISDLKGNGYGWSTSWGISFGKSGNSTPNYPETKRYLTYKMNSVGISGGAGIYSNSPSSVTYINVSKTPLLFFFVWHERMWF